MAEELTLAERIKESRFMVAAVRREPVSQARMAELMTAELQRSVHATQWARYESGESEPPLDVIIATSRLSGFREEYVAFGKLPKIEPVPLSEPPAPADAPERAAAAKKRRGA